MVTSYLAADVLFSRDHLVHVGSQHGIQLRSLDLTGFGQCFVLTGGLSQHLLVHRIRDLEERVMALFEPLLCLYIISAVHFTVKQELTNIQFLCLCCIFPFRRGPITFLSSGWRVSITRLARICTHRGYSVYTLFICFYIIHYF